MKKFYILFNFLFIVSCQNFGQLQFINDLPSYLKEVSGVEIDKTSKTIWMHNDGGNKPMLYGFSFDGKLHKEIYIKAKNKDWEDITIDDNGNIFIGDFGNNNNDRKDLTILKIDKSYLTKKNAEVEKINFQYPNQKKFPPKKRERFFDSESFFYFKNNLYIFTKSRVKKQYGKTTLYKIPAEKGNHVAEILGEFENCKKSDCWITAADISPNGKKVVLLSQKNILIFSDFKKDNFLSGNVKKIELKHRSQKEGICFKDNNTLLITDEYARGNGGNLYELKI